MEADDPSFVAALRARDGDAFETLVRAHAARLLRVARRFLPVEEEARDAVQDAFFSAYKSIGKFQAGSSLSTWLHRIVVNASLMKLRSKRRKPEESIDHLLPHFKEDGHQRQASQPWPVSAEEMVQRVETSELVRRLINQLPESYREVLVMRDLEEMSTEETATALGVTPNAIKVRLHRARQALRTLLEPHVRSLAT